MDIEEYIVGYWIRDDTWQLVSRCYSSICGKEIEVIIPADALYPTIRLAGS